MVVLCTWAVSVGLVIVELLGVCCVTSRALNNFSAAAVNGSEILEGVVLATTVFKCLQLSVPILSSSISTTLPKRDMYEDNAELYKCMDSLPLVVHTTDVHRSIDAVICLVVAAGLIAVSNEMIESILSKEMVIN